MICESEKLLWKGRDRMQLDIFTVFPVLVFRLILLTCSFNFFSEILIIDVMRLAFLRTAVVAVCCSLLAIESVAERSSPTQNDRIQHQYNNVDRQNTIRHYVVEDLIHRARNGGASKHRERKNCSLTNEAEVQLPTRSQITARVRTETAKNKGKRRMKTTKVLDGVQWSSLGSSANMRKGGVAGNKLQWSVERLKRSNDSAQTPTPTAVPLTMHSNRRYVPYVLNHLRSNVVPPAANMLFVVRNSYVNVSTER